MALKNNKDELCNHFMYGETIFFEFVIQSKKEEEVQIGISVNEMNSTPMVHFSNREQGVVLNLRNGENIIKANFTNILNKGGFNCSVWISDSHNIVQDRVKNCVSFYTDTYNLGVINYKGGIIPKVNWGINTYN